MLLRYRDVKRAAHDWETYTSDAPFRVPIPAEFDERRVRNCPSRRTRPNIALTAVSWESRSGGEPPADPPCDRAAGR